MHNRWALNILQDIIYCGNPETPGFVRMRLQVWVVDLNHISACKFQIRDLFSQDVCVGHNKCFWVSVVFIQCHLGHSEWTWNCYLNRQICICLSKGHFSNLNRVISFNFCNDARNRSGLACASGYNPWIIYINPV